MKAKLLAVLFVSLLSVLSLGTSVKAQVHVSVYVNIPLAPNIVLSIGSPAIQAPTPDYIWIDGYWTWDYRHHNYVWVQGRWALAPYADAYWIPGYWEYYRSGYRWIDACWMPRTGRINFGYCNGRYDYYGRPVYYHHYDPRSYRHGYAYSYDHNPDHRKKGYNSSSHFNSSPGKEREAINRKYNNPRPAPTTQRSAVRNYPRSSSPQESTVNNTGRNNNHRPSGESNSQTTTRSKENNRTNKPEAVHSGSRTGSQNEQTPTAGSRSDDNRSRQSVSSGSRQSSPENVSSRNNSRERSSSTAGRTNSSDRSR
jgi:hypothetical protein